MTGVGPLRAFRVRGQHRVEYSGSVVCQMLGVVGREIGRLKHVSSGGGGAVSFHRLINFKKLIFIFLHEIVLYS